METADIITASRQTLTQESNSLDIHSALIAEGNADESIRVAMAGVGNDVEAREIEQALTRIHDTKQECRIALRVATHQKAEASPELHCDLAGNVLLKADAANAALSAAIVVFHKLSFRLHRKLETGDITQEMYDREQAAYQAAMAHIAGSWEVYQHLSRVWHDEYQERLKKVNSFGNRLDN